MSDHISGHVTTLVVTSVFVIGLISYHFMKFFSFPRDYDETGSFLSDGKAQEETRTSDFRF